MPARWAAAAVPRLERPSSPLLAVMVVLTLLWLCPMPRTTASSLHRQWTRAQSHQLMRLATFPSSTIPQPPRPLKGAPLASGATQETPTLLSGVSFLCGALWLLAGWQAPCLAVALAAGAWWWRSWSLRPQPHRSVVWSMAIAEALAEFTASTAPTPAQGWAPGNEAGGQERHDLLGCEGWLGEEAVSEDKADQPVEGERQSNAETAVQTREWRRYDRAPAANGSEADLHLAEKVQRILRKWEVCRTKALWDEADRLREGLWALGVMAEERTAEWMVVPVEPRTQRENAVCIWDLPPHTTRDQLLEHCCTFGRVMYCAILSWHPQGRKRALVRFWSDQEAAVAVQQLPNYPLDGAVLQVDFDRFAAPPSSLESSISVGDTLQRWSRDTADAKSETSPDVLFVREVQQLLAQRDVLRARQMKSQAEAIRDRLRKKGVIVNDASHTWFCIEANPMEPAAVVVSNVPEWTTWIQLRKHFRQCGTVTFVARFPKRIHSKTNKHIVWFEDKEGAMRALEKLPHCPLDGTVLKVHLLRSDQLRDPPQARLSKEPWKRQELDVPKNPSEEDEAFARWVQGECQERQRLRDVRKFAEADAIREELLAHLVVLDDKTRTWTLQRMDREAPADYNCIIVRNLPLWATSNALRDHFSAFGRVRFAGVFQKRHTGEPTGSGKVRFDNAHAAKAAVLRSGHYPMQGRLLEVIPSRIGSPDSPTPGSTPAMRRWVRDRRDATADGSEQDREFTRYVQQQLMKRELLRGKQEFGKADTILHELKDRGVVLDEMRQTWSFGPLGDLPWVRAENDSAARGTKEDKDFVHQVQRLLNARQAAKFHRDFAKADAIEGELRNMSVKVENVQRVWWSGYLTS